MSAITLTEMVKSLIERGYLVAQRDRRVNTDYRGKYMVIESDYESHELPTKDGANGPWCIVGDNFNDLIARAYRDAP